MRRPGAAARLRAATRLLPGGADRPARLTRGGQRLRAVSTREVSYGLFSAGSMERGPRRFPPALLTPFATSAMVPRDPRKGREGKDSELAARARAAEKGSADNQLWRAGTQAPLTCPNPAHPEQREGWQEPRGRAA